MKPFDQMDAWWVSCVRVTTWGGHMVFIRKADKRLLCRKLANSSFLVYVAIQKGCSLLAFQRNFIALVFLVYVTRPVVVTAAVYDEQIVYYFMSPCKGVLAPCLYFDVIS
jgi:hypothetical protein